MHHKTDLHPGALSATPDRAGRLGNQVDPFHVHKEYHLDPRIIEATRMMTPYPVMNKHAIKQFSWNDAQRARILQRYRNVS